MHTAIATVIRRYPLVTYFVLAHLFTWPFIIAIALYGAPLETSFVAALGPTAAAMLAHRWSGEGGPAFRWHGGWTRTLLGCALCGGLTLFACTVLPALLLSEDPRKLKWGVLAAAGSYNWSTLLGGPLGEEPGWRGYALPRMQVRFGVLGGTLLVGLIWTCWHLPGFLSDAWPHPPFSIYLPIVVSVSVILSLGTNVARFGVLPAMLGHAVLNTTGTYIGGLFATEPMSAKNVFWESFGAAAKWAGAGPVSMGPSTVIAGCAVTVALAIVVATRGRLGAAK